MGLLDRIGMVVRSNVNAMVTAAEDPEKILEQSIIDMQENLVQLRQAVAQAMAAFKRQEQQYNAALAQAQEWERRAMLALQKGDENLAREALTRKKAHTDTVNSMKASLDQQSAQVETLKRNLIALESKISEAKTKKDMLKARLQSAKAQENLNNMMGKINTSSAAATFERMEERVMMAEAKASATAELGLDNLESQFARLEAGSGVDDEMMALKARMLASSSPAGALPPTDSSRAGALPPTDSSRAVGGATQVDSELEELRRQMGR